MACIEVIHLQRVVKTGWAGDMVFRRWVYPQVRGMDEGHLN